MKTLEQLNAEITQMLEKLEQLQKQSVQLQIDADKLAENKRGEQPSAKAEKEWKEIWRAEYIVEVGNRIENDLKRLNDYVKP